MTPGLTFGRQSACGATNGAMDTQQVDVPAHDEHGVHNSTHQIRITWLDAVCPVLVSHAIGNPGGGQGYSAPGQSSFSGLRTRCRAHAQPRAQPCAQPAAQPCAQPWRTQLSRGSAVCAAVSWEARCWQSHHVPPRQSWCSRPRHETQIITAIVPLPARCACQSPFIRRAARGPRHGAPGMASGHRHLTFPISNDGICHREKRTLEFIPRGGMYFMIMGQKVGDSNLSDP